MKIIYPKLNIVNTRCNGRVNIKEQSSCICTAAPSKENGWVKRRGNNLKDIIGISNA